MNERQIYELWCSKNLEDQDLIDELEAMKNKPELIKESFFQTLEFGTGGLRGILGAGTNRMNIYTVRSATQGFAIYLKKHFENPSIAISFDSRNKSDLFAAECARVMAANGVKAYLYRELMPTPALSFAVRTLGCSGGIMVTASHNPAKYNGYKAYDEHGCQLTDAPAKEVIEEVKRVDVFDGVKVISLEEGLKAGTISYIDQCVIEAYYKAVLSCRVEKNEEEVSHLKVVYTPLNGAGKNSVAHILKQIGLTELHIVKEQAQPDGNFPTCPYPNPETKEAMALALTLAQKVKPDIVVATDPDSDRAGLAVPVKGQYQILSGNEIGILLLDYLIQKRLEANTLPKEGLVVKTIVSSKLIDKICKKYALVCKDVLTGFKYIGEQILLLEKQGKEENFVFGYEESYGYLSGAYVRDKDAVLACMLLVQMAAAYKAKGYSLFKRLQELYEEYGYLLNYTASYEFEGLSGMEKMRRIMNTLRDQTPTQFAGDFVVTVKDYFLQKSTSKGVETPIALPKSNVLEFCLQSGSSVIIRPSGTEPKVKAYFSVEAQTKAECETTLKNLQREVEGFMK